jgi:hypothetical protein
VLTRGKWQGAPWETPVAYLNVQLDIPDLKAIRRKLDELHGKTQPRRSGRHKARA